MKAALETERARFHGFQDFVGKDMNGWAELLAVPSTAPVEGVRILSAQYSQGGVTLIIDAASDLPVRLERAASLAPGTWLAVPNAVEVATAGQRRLTDPSPLPGAAFYRIAVGRAALGSARSTPVGNHPDSRVTRGAPSSGMA